jgi:hypothetical protein
MTAPLPADASADFLSLVAATAGELRDEAKRRSAAAANADDATDWREISEDAASRLQHVEERLGKLRVMERTPEVDRQALIDIIGEPAFRAVNERIPVEADSEDLQYLNAYIDHVVDELDGLQQRAHATTISPAYIREQFDKASDRLNELEARLEQLADAAALEPEEQRIADRREEFTRDDVAANPWALVEKEIPRDLDAATLTAAREAVAGCVAALAWELEQENRRDGERHAPEYLDARLETASARLAELDGRLEGTHAADFGREQSDDVIRSAAGFLSGDLIDRQSARSTERAMDLILNVLERGAGDELRPAQQQLEEIAGVSRERSDASAEESERSDTVYERYPGLTRDVDDTREREQQRAFYDTGIERSR